MFEQMVGAEGFEPPTPWTQTRCASQAALRPEPLLASTSRRGNLLRSPQIARIIVYIADF